MVVYSLVSVYILSLDFTFTPWPEYGSLIYYSAMFLQNYETKCRPSDFISVLCNALFSLVRSAVSHVVRGLLHLSGGGGGGGDGETCGLPHTSIKSNVTKMYTLYKYFFNFYLVKIGQLKESCQNVQNCQLCL